MSIKKYVNVNDDSLWVVHVVNEDDTYRVIDCWDKSFISDTAHLISHAQWYNQFKYKIKDVPLTMSEVLKYSANNIPQWMKEIKLNNTQCLHEIKHYIGFKESFHYCIKCDIKKAG
jgi:hypothetical protein